MSNDDKYWTITSANGKTQISQNKRLNKLSPSFLSSWPHSPFRSLSYARSIFQSLISHRALEALILQFIVRLFNSTPFSLTSSMKSLLIINLFY